MTDTPQDLLKRILALDPMQRAQVEALLSRLERPAPVSTAVLSPWSAFSDPKPIQGAQDLPQWKRRIICTRPWFDPGHALVESWTQNPDWPINRMVKHVDLGVWILYSSTYLDYARIPSEPLSADDTRVLTVAARGTERSLTVWPLARIPQARAHQQSDTYRWMRVDPRLGPCADYSAYPIPANTPRCLTIDVTRLRQWLLILGNERATTWSLSNEIVPRLVLRTPYFVVIQNLAMYPPIGPGDLED